MKRSSQGQTLGNLARRGFAVWLVGFALALSFSPILAHAAPLRSDPPATQAHSAVLVDYNTGRILYAKLPHDIKAIASTTKIMTAILAIEHGNLDDVITANADDIAGESSMGLVVGEQHTLRDLLYGMLLPSGNDAAMAIARYIGNKLGEPADEKDPIKRFVNLMNQEANRLGLHDTHYANPHGLDDAYHTSSAYDLATITWYALHNPTFAQIVGTSSYTISGHYLLNTNELLTRYPGADGVKTGLTDNAGLCLVGSASRNGQRMISVVLNSPTWYDDSKALLDYGFDSANAIAGGAPPGPDQQEILPVAQRASLSWTLVNALPTEAAPTVTPPPPPTLAPMTQGGPGPSSNNQNPASQNPASQNPASQNNPNQANGSGIGAIAQNVPLNQPPVVMVNTLPPQNSSDGFPFIWLLVVAAFLLLVFFLAQRVGFNFALGGGSRRQFAQPIAKAPLQGGGNRFWDTSAARPKVEAPMHSRVVELSSREEPLEPLSAILNAPVIVSQPQTDELRDHAWRAVEYAYAERHGSAMAEFMAVVKHDSRYEFDSLPGFYEMPPVGYLALARAYYGVGKLRYAHALLILAAQCYPGDMNIRMMRRRIETEMSDAA
jgi:D-alanyl-D-alanine carboxypeptidase